MLVALLFVECVRLMVECCGVLICDCWLVVDWRLVIVGCCLLLSDGSVAVDVVVGVSTARWMVGQAH